MNKFVIIAIAAIAFTCVFFKNAPTKFQPPSVDKTLNSVDGATARKWIAYFQTNSSNDKYSKSVYAWYSYHEIELMNSLLTTEHTKKGTDGVRFYFGADPSVGGSKLEMNIFPVSTIPQSIPGHSSHGDDYMHASSSYLSTTNPFGIAKDHDADNATTHGARLYGSNLLTNDFCANPSSHYIDVVTCQKWARKHRESSTSDDTKPINTCSEWFDICFIQSLFNAILDKKNNLNGLRIYLGKGKIPKYTYERDLFILVPTKINSKTGNSDDYYRCLEDKAPSFCKDYSARLRKNAVQHHSNWMMGGYDNGELCPDVCN